MGKGDQDKLERQMKRTLREAKRSLREIREDSKDSDNGWELVEKLLASNALGAISAQMLANLAEPPKKSDGTPILEWPTAHEDQERVVKYLMERQRSTEIAIYNLATSLKSLLLLALFLGKGKDGGLFGGSGGLLPVLLLSGNGSMFNIFGGAQLVTGTQIWDGDFA